MALHFAPDDAQAAAPVPRDMSDAPAVVGPALVPEIVAPAAAQPAEAPAAPAPAPDDPHVAERAFLAVDRGVIEDVLSDILRAAARRHGVEV